MVAVDNATAAELLGQPVSDHETAMRRIVFSLSRALAREAVSEELVDLLDTVLMDPPFPGPAASGRHRGDGFLTRCGFPRLRRPQHTAPPPLTGDEAARIAARFRAATAQFIQAAPHRIAWYPTEELRLLSALRDERPAPDQFLPYLRRYALALLAVLDLMGDDT
ncbi:hypothetical protein [Streptomyces sp. NPDC058657]|uniref:hypothetical protein n=1 Tax=unclassified Streptomyces TaxID=2593676 RepID=UPI00365B6987